MRYLLQVFLMISLFFFVYIFDESGWYKKPVTVDIAIG